MTPLNCYKFKFSWNFAPLRIFGRQLTTAKRMKIDPHCQRGNCCPPIIILYQGCCALTFALARLSCYNVDMWAQRCSVLYKLTPCNVTTVNPATYSLISVCCVWAWWSSLRARPISAQYVLERQRTEHEAHITRRL